jgi:hypothetical protein
MYVIHRRILHRDMDPYRSLQVPVVLHVHKSEFWMCNSMDDKRHFICPLQGAYVIAVPTFRNPHDALLPLVPDPTGGVAVSIPRLTVDSRHISYFTQLYAVDTLPVDSRNEATK